MRVRLPLRPQHVQRLFGVLRRQIDQPALVPPLRNRDRHFLPRPLVLQPALNDPRFLDELRDHDLRWHFGGIVVKALDECRQHLAVILPFGIVQRPR
ncbi:MAG: hypothetical protein CUN53_19370, partial [Phototrophicales bacterium]